MVSQVLVSFHHKELTLSWYWPEVSNTQPAVRHTDGVVMAIDDAALPCVC